MSRGDRLRGGARPGAGVRVGGFPDPRDRRAVGDAIRTALRRLKADRIGVDVTAIGTEDSMRLNRRYRRRRRPGDVLSFPLPADEPGGTIGEVYLCPPLVLRGARRQGIAPRRWLAHLAVHGTLHLLGFDHRTPAEAGRMEGLTRALLAPAWSGQ